jgi:hypothetical protein
MCDHKLDTTTIYKSQVCETWCMHEENNLLMLLAIIDLKIWVH